MLLTIIFVDFSYQSPTTERDHATWNTVDSSVRGHVLSSTRFQLVMSQQLVLKGYIRFASHVLTQLSDGVA